MKVLRQVSWRTLSIWFVLLCPFSMPVLAEITFPIAQSNVENWQPTQFDILCGAVGGPINPDPRDTSCVCPNDDATVGGICLRPSPELAWESHLQLAAKEFRDLQFHSPDGFGPVISDHGTGVPKVRIYASPLEGASARVDGIRKWLPVDECHPGALARMTIDPSAIHMTDDEFIAYLAAHELYHTVQNALPEGRKRLNSRRGGCLRPKWIIEGHATTIGIDYSRKRYPREFPARDGLAKDHMSGLRPYHWPLHVRFPDQPPIRIGLPPRKSFTAYKTSSFWLHIGDRYRKGDFHFIQDYQINAAPTYGDGKEDWLQWLDRNLLRDQKVKTPLYRVYPGFLTHFLGAWDKGGVGDFYLKSSWTKAAFGKCLELKLSPAMPFAYTEAKLKAMSGRCVSVTINGLTGTQLASVKLAAYTTRQHVDDLHMGFAYTNDRTGFNCGHAVRTHRIPRGKLECLLEPVTSYEQNTGDPDEPATRYWNGILVEPGFSSATAKTEPPPPGDYLDMDDQKAAEPPESADSDDGKKSELVDYQYVCVITRSSQTELERIGKST